MGEFGNHYLAYAFELRSTLEGNEGGGGLATAIAREAALNRNGKALSLRVLSADGQAGKVPGFENIEIKAADAEKVANGDRFGVWFVDKWVVFHHQAYTTGGGYTNEVLNILFQGGEYTHPVGSLDRAVEHVDKFGFFARNPQALKVFADRFDKQIQAIPSSSIINWQDYMFVPSILKHAQELRERGCWQSFHQHANLPDGLGKFALGRNFLQAMSLMDRVYVHTDLSTRLLEQQLLGLNLFVPEIRRYDLGVDAVNIQVRIDGITASNYQESREYKKLSSSQRETVDEIVGTQNSGLHRFVVTDRADEVKGATVVLDGMDQLLSSISEGEREAFRFYFVLPQLEWADNEVKYSPKHNYTAFLKKKLDEMKQKYPKVLYFMPGIPPGLVPLVQTDANAITGGIQDGLCLSPLEVLKVNSITGHNRNAIIGEGVGFATQTLSDERNRHLVHFVRPGSVDEMAQAIRDIVEVEKNNPEVLGQLTRKIVKEVVDKRTDGVVVYP